MKQQTNRLYFIDAMRAWAILMMLQGHFVDGLLDPAFRDASEPVYQVWLYFRGITAPVFFTVSGFIFTYLLIRVPQTGLQNPRVNKGLKRGLQLLAIGYLLRLNLFGLLQGKLYDSFYLVDVLQCIGLSILGVIGFYLLTVGKRRWVFPALLLGSTLVLFLLEPAYKQLAYPFLPDALENYLTKVNGSIFTIIPWFGYSTFGAFLSVLFTRFKNARYLYPVAIGISLVSGFLLLASSPAFAAMAEWTGSSLFKEIFNNNYLFIRLGNVMLVFAIFMALRHFLKSPALLKLGQNTLSIYVIHFVILYGSLTGFGLYYFFNHSIAPIVAVPGAIGFMILCSYTSLQYAKREVQIKGRIVETGRQLGSQLERVALDSSRLMKSISERVVRLVGLLKAKARYNS